MIGRCAALLAGALLLDSARAASVELQFVTLNGSGIAGIKARLNARAPYRGQHLCAESDAQGRAACPSIEPGEYTVTFHLPKQLYLADPVEAGLAPELNFAVTASDQVLRFEIPVPRADLLYTTANLDARVYLSAVEEATGSKRELLIRLGDSVTSLSPGRWHLTLRPQQGHLIESIELDGENIQSLPIPLDVFDSGTRHDLNLTLIAACQVDGTLSWTDANRPPGFIVATLIEPGPLMARARAFGFPAEARYESRPSPNGDYSLILPDGRWRLSVEGSELAAREPEEFVLDLVAGTQRRADFRVTVKPEVDTGAGRLKVQLIPPNGVEPHVVRGELRRALEHDQPGEIVRESHFSGRRDHPWLAFGSIPPGRYIVVAGALNTGELASAPIEIEKGDDREEQLALPAASTLTARLTGASGSRLVAVEVRLDRLTSPEHDGSPRLVDPGFRALKDRRRGRFDLTNTLRMMGVATGRYQLSARFVHPGEVDTLLRLEIGEQSAFERLEFDVRETDTIDVAVKLVPAARVSGILKCLDGESLPRRIDLRLISESIDPPLEAAQPYSFDTLPVKARDGAVLVGRDLNELAAGPFEPEDAYVALRPQGFARWTWAFGTEDPSRAAVVGFVEQKTAELGIVPVDCRPSVKLLFATPQGETIPDLEDLTVTLAEARTLPRPGIEEPFGEWRPAAPELHPEFLRLKRLPTGRSALRAQLRHRFFVPNLISIGEESGARTLALGGEELVQVVVPQLGGAIKVPVGVAALKLVMPGGSTTIGDGAGLVAGVYQVEACADAACREVVDRWDNVVVEAGKDTVLSHAGEP